jgi:hypothetical protein
MQNPVAFHAEMMGDIMYYHQALQQPDAKQFADAIFKEVNGHVDNNHWNLIKQEDVPEDEQVVPSVWSMRRRSALVGNPVFLQKWLDLFLCRMPYLLGLQTSIPSCTLHH